MEPLEQRLLLNGAGPSQFVIGDPIAAGTGPMGIDAADISGGNGPGDQLDFTIADYAGNYIAVNWWDAAAHDYVLRRYADHGFGPTAVRFADLNGDGNQDLVAVNSVSNEISVYLYDPDGQGPSQEDLVFDRNYGAGAGSTPVGLAIGDFDGVNGPDVAVTNNASNTVWVFYNDGTGRLVNPDLMMVGSKPKGIAAADFDQDGYDDLVVTGEGTNTLTFLKSKGAAGFDFPVDYTVGHSPSQVAAFDIDGNGTPDGVAVTNTADGTVGVLYWSAGAFGGYQVHGAGAAPVGIAAADLDADTGDELIVANSGGDSLTLLDWEAPQQRFQAGAGNPYFVGEMPQSLCAKDINGDSYADVLASCYKDDAAVLLTNQPGAFRVILGESGPASKLKYTDSDGTTVTVAMTGPGSATLFFRGTGLGAAVAKGIVTVTGTNVEADEIWMARTTAASGLAFTTTETATSVHGAGISHFYTMAPLKTVSAPAIDFGDPTGGGIWCASANGYIGALKIRDLAAASAIRIDGRTASAGLSIEGRDFMDDTTLEAASPIKKLAIHSWVDAGQDGGEVLSGTWINTLAVTGDFDADLALSQAGPAPGRFALKTATIGGTVHGSANGWVSLAPNPACFGAITAGAIASGFGGTAAYCGAAGIQSLTVKGNCDLALNLAGSGSAQPVLGSAKISGNLSGSWNISQLVGAGGGVGTLQVSGDVLDTASLTAGWLGALTVGGTYGGSLHLQGTGAQALTLGTARILGQGGITSKATVTVFGPIGTLMADSINAAIMTESIKTLAVTHDMAANLTLSGHGTISAGLIALGTATLGSASAGAWTITGGVDRLAVAGDFAANLGAAFAKTLAVGGAYTGHLELSGVGAGATALASAIIGGDLASDQWILGDTFSGTYRGIGKLTVGGNVSAPIMASSIGTLTVDGDCGGDLQLTGHWLAKNALDGAAIKGSLTNAGWTVTGSIGSLTVGADFGAAGQSFYASSIGTLAIGKDCFASLYLLGTGTSAPALGTVKVAGDIHSQDWWIGGDAGGVIVAGRVGDAQGGTATLLFTGSVKSLTLGSVRGASFLVGVSQTPSDVGSFLAEGQTDPAARIGAIRITGTPSGQDPLVSQAVFAAGGIGKVTLGRTDFITTGLWALGTAHGGGGIASVDYADGAYKWSWPNDTNTDTTAMIHVLGDNAL
jgi:hypothetical protein